MRGRVQFIDYIVYRENRGLIRDNILRHALRCIVLREDFPCTLIKILVVLHPQKRVTILWQHPIEKEEDCHISKHSNYRA